MLEFSAIMSAVKPRDRTDQYAILAALFHLNAHNAPVSAKQVNDLLRLHLGKPSPRNVNASLRSYTSFVEVASQGPPLSWTLTSNGLNRLRSISGLTLATAAAESDFGTDVAFLCALEYPEFSALAKALGSSKSWDDSGSGRFARQRS